MFLYTIPNLSILFMIITALIAILVPIILPIIIHKKTNQSWRVYIVGAAAWITFALLIEGFINNRVTSLTDIQSHIWIYALYGGLAAGIFEETGRWIAFKYILKDEKKPETPLMYGAGHGGIEAIILVGLPVIVNIFIAIMINSGSISSIIKDPTTLQTTLNQFKTLSTTSSATFLLGGAERILAIIIHLVFSIIVFKAVRENKIGYFFLAIGLHALTDFGAIAITHFIATWQYEIILLGETIILAFLGYKLFKKTKIEYNENNPEASETL